MTKRTKILIFLSTALILVAIWQFTPPGIVLQLLLFEATGSVGYFVVLGAGVLGSVLLTLFALLSRRTLLHGLMFCTLFGSLLISNGMWFLRDYSRKERMQNLRTTLTSMQSEGRTLPQSLTADPDLHTYKSFFGLDGIHYTMTNSHFTIESYGVPIGPFEAYSSQDDRTSHYE